MTVAWWTWIALGIIILLAEAVTPGGFYLLFFGIAGIITGACAPFIKTLWIEIAMFAALSAVLIAFVRKPLVKRLRKDTPKADAPEFIGETARALESILPGQEGSVELRGSVWKALNSGEHELPRDAACIINARDGLKFIVKQK
jgi:membrane protein implicated in regulation of membrane protease activity